MASSRVESVPSQSYILKTLCIKIESRRKPKFRSKVHWDRAWLGGSRGGHDSWFGSPFSSDTWDPDSSSFLPSRGQSDRGNKISTLASAHVDWRETDTAREFRVDLPEARKEEVKVVVEDGNILQISGERTEEEEDKNDKWHRIERRRGSFVRRFRLPENVKLDEIKCTLEHGVLLTLTVPKKETEQTPNNVKYIDVV